MVNDYHISVLSESVLRFMPTNPDGVYVDGTVGGGGHAELLLQQLSVRGKVIGFDMDAEAIQYAKRRLSRYEGKILFVQDNFMNMKSRLRECGIDRIDGLLLDLGVSSHQIDEPNRGFSFRSSARLDMRMNRDQRLDAWIVVNTYDQDQLADIIFRYGEERASRRIAKRIVSVRSQNKIETTNDLAAIIEQVVGGRMLEKSLARVFQALRIEVNGEMENLRRALVDATDLLEPEGRVVVISYHSLEDRIVKEFFREEARTSVPSGHKLLPDKPRRPRLKVLIDKPVQASEDEVRLNPRSRSAKLRAAERM